MAAVNQRSSRQSLSPPGQIPKAAAGICGARPAAPSPTWRKYLRLSWEARPTKAFFLRAETFYNVASAYDELELEDLDSYHERSHGESFIHLIKRQFGPGGFYIMDEPDRNDGLGNLVRAGHTIGAVKWFP